MFFFHHLVQRQDGLYLKLSYYIVEVQFGVNWPLLCDMSAINNTTVETVFRSFLSDILPF